MNGAAERALRCLGRGFDLACDFRAKYCKGKEKLVLINEEETHELLVPGFDAIRDVSVDILCDKGERIRYQSDVLEFDRMSELFNRRSSVTGRIPSGLFNAMFAFGASSWGQDAAETKCLAMDGYFISLFNLSIGRRKLVLSDHVIGAVPYTWDTAALARFIENYGTHIVVGLSVGGQDVVYVRQDHSSNISPSELKRHLDQLGDQLFTGTCTIPPKHSKSKENRHKVPDAFKVFDPEPALLDGFTTVSCRDGLTVICSKRGGDASTSSHCEWLPTVPSMPDIINFKFVPITTLLKSVPGTGFLSHAINLYLRYKPPISELQYFLDFQSHKSWAPMLNDHPLGPSSNRPIPAPALNFNLMGPKLYVNTTQVTVRRHPITGMRLHLEGKKNNRLAVHLQHLSSTPAYIGDHPTPNQVVLWQGSDTVTNEGYYEAVHGKRFSYACTAPVEYDPWSSPSSRGAAFIVTGAQLFVKTHGSTSMLHLRLLFSVVPGCTISQSRWERGASGLSQKSGSFFSTISTFSTNADKEKPQLPVFMIDSGVFPTGPPAPPVKEQKLLRFVDASHVCMGPEDSPGHWLVTGAKLDLAKGKIGLHVKFSLLTTTS